MVKEVTMQRGSHDQKTIRVCLKGMHDGQTLTMIGGGFQDEGHEANDLIVTLSQVRHSCFEHSGYELIMYYTVSPEQAGSGFTVRRAEVAWQSFLQQCG